MNFLYSINLVMFDLRKMIKYILYVSLSGFIAQGVVGMADSYVEL